MTGAPRSYFFRARPGGAMLLKITHDPRLRRSEMHRIAGVDRASGKITPSAGHELTKEEQGLIARWLDDAAARRDGRAGKAAQAVADIGHIAHWAQFQASPEELAAITDDLLWAMQDLRAVLVRKLAQHNAQPGPDAGEA